MTIKQRLLKTLYPLIMLKGKLFPSEKDIQKNILQVAPLSSIYEIEIIASDGSIISLQNYKGKKLVIINTASDCGYTAQYDDLESIYTEYKAKVVMIAFPANDFMEQETAKDEAIAQFCRMNYGISFPIAKKSSVIKGSMQYPIYQWLTTKEKNGWCNEVPIWNFCKYVINENGILTHFFSQNVSPNSDVFLAAILQ